MALSSHGYPINFYLSQCRRQHDPNWCGANYGFALSQEMEGVFWINNQANYPVGTGPFLPCSPPDAVKNPIPGIAGLESGAAGAWVLITAIQHALVSTGTTLLTMPGLSYRAFGWHCRFEVSRSSSDG